MLIGLATYSCSADGVMCRPEFQLSQQPFLDIKNGRHPCIVRTFSGDDFIPNDVTIGEKEVRVTWWWSWSVHMYVCVFVCVCLYVYRHDLSQESTEMCNIYVISVCVLLYIRTYTYSMSVCMCIPSMRYNFVDLSTSSIPYEMHVHAYCIFGTYVW